MPISNYISDLRETVGTRLLQIPSITVLIWDEDGRLLLVKQSDPDIWSTPGGTIEPQETPADAALREAWEETGLQGRLTRVVGAFGGPEYVTQYRNGDLVSYVQIVFDAVSESGALRIDEDEILELRYFSREEIASLPVPEWLAEVLSGKSYRSPTWSPPSAG
jgi:8-oxo-dGTP pyrophosphatase MutT (NUDIX family)